LLVEAKADVNARNSWYDPLRVCYVSDVRFNSLVLVGDGLRSIGLPEKVTSSFVDFSWRRKLT
jgi:hypothetical protein